MNPHTESTHMVGLVTYQWKNGSRLKADAQAVGEIVARLDEEGQAVPAVLVAEAKSPESPLHPCFEWNNGRAAQLYREQQALYVLRSLVRVEEDEDGGKPRQMRAFVVVTEDDVQHYTDTARAMGDPDLRRQVIERAERELDAWRRRYHDFVEFAEIFEAMDRLPHAAD